MSLFKIHNQDYICKASCRLFVQHCKYLSCNSHFIKGICEYWLCCFFGKNKTKKTLSVIWKKSVKSNHQSIMLPSNNGIKEHQGNWFLYGLGVIVSTIHHHCTYTHTHTSHRSNTPSYKVSEEDQEMMKQLHVLYKTPCFWSDPQPPPPLSLLLLLSYFPADVGRKCASLKMKQNKQMRLGALTSLCNPS